MAYFLTFTTYGAWLHGRQAGSVDREHNTPGTPFLPADAEMEAARRKVMRQQPYLLDEAKRTGGAPHDPRGGGPSPLEVVGRACPLESRSHRDYGAPQTGEGDGRLQGMGESALA